MENETNRMLHAILENQLKTSAQLDALTRDVRQLQTGQEEIKNRLEQLEEGQRDLGESLNYLVKDVYLLKHRTVGK